MEVMDGDFSSGRKKDVLYKILDETVPTKNAFIMYSDTDEFHIYPESYFQYVVGETMVVLVE